MTLHMQPDFRHVKYEEKLHFRNNDNLISSWPEKIFFNKLKEANLHTFIPIAFHFQTILLLY